MLVWPDLSIEKHVHRSLEALEVVGKREEPQNVLLVFILFERAGCILDICHVQPGQIIKHFDIGPSASRSCAFQANNM